MSNGLLWPDSRLLSVDLPGYGASPRPQEWELDAIAADIEREVEERFGQRPRTVLGFCSGSIFSLLLAQRRPELTERIVLIDPFASVPWYFRIFLLGEFGRRAYAATFQSKLGRSVTDWIVRRLQKQDADFTAAFQDLDHEVARKYLEMLNRADVRRFGDLRIATDILYGESTFAEVRKSVALFCELWPHARKIAMPGVGHLPLLQGVRQLASVVFTQEGGRP